MYEPESKQGAAVRAPKVGERVSRERLLEVIASIRKDMTVSGSLQAVMDVVAEECARLTRADGATIFMVENQRLTAKAAVGILGFVMLEMPLTGGSPSSAIKLNRAVRSFGWYSMAGEVTTILTAVILLPALLALARPREPETESLVRRRSAAGAPPDTL